MLVNQFSKSTLMFLLCGMLLSGCFQKSDQALEEIGSPVSSDVTAPKIIAASPANEVTPTSVNVNVYLEISNGMKGFMPAPTAGKKPTEFQSRVVKMLSDVQYGGAASTSYFYAMEDKQSKPALDSVSFDVLKSTITSGIQSDVRGTPLPELIKQALEKSAKQNAISIIVSDFIHGPKVPGDLISVSGDVRGSLQLVKEKGLVVAVFGDASSFYGSYHPAVKTPEKKIPLQGEAPIPYYIWVIGKQGDVQYLTSKMLSSLPAQQAYYGFTYKSVPYSALPKSAKFPATGNVYCTTKAPAACTSISLSPEKDVPVEFMVGLDLRKLPEPLQQATYLDRHLKVSGFGAKASKTAVIVANSATRSNPDLAKFTHFVRLSVPSLSAAKGTITISLPHVNPAWVSAWSTTDDNNPKANPKKTFQFDRIIEGVQDLYKSQKQDVFNVTMNFNKAE